MLVILFFQFFPKMVPAGGVTEVTLCGSEFQSVLRPPIISGKTHIVTVARGPCVMSCLKRAIVTGE